MVATSPTITAAIERSIEATTVRVRAQRMELRAFAILVITHCGIMSTRMDGQNPDDADC